MGEDLEVVGNGCGAGGVQGGMPVMREFLGLGMGRRVGPKGGWAEVGVPAEGVEDVLTHRCCRG